MRLATGLLILLLTGAFLRAEEKVAYSSDPCSFASGGTELWNAIAARWQIGGSYSDELKPFFIFSDGKNIAIFSRAYVDSFEGGSKCPITVVLPGQKTIDNSGNFSLVTPLAFLDMNAAYVNKVTHSSSPDSGKLNVYVDDVGNLCTKEHMAK